MSATLFYRPIKTGRKSAGDKLKRILQDRYEMYGGKHRIGSGDLDYLRGLMDAGVDDAKKLVDAIEKHGDIEIWLES